MYNWKQEEIHRLSVYMTSICNEHINIYIYIYIYLFKTGIFDLTWRVFNASAEFTACVSMSLQEIPAALCRSVCEYVQVF